MKLTLLILKNI